MPRQSGVRRTRSAGLDKQNPTKTHHAMRWPCYASTYHVAVHLHRPPFGHGRRRVRVLSTQILRGQQDVTTQAVWAFGTLSCCTYSWPAGRGKAIPQPLHVLLGSALARSYGHYIHKLSRYHTSGQSPSGLAPVFPTRSSMTVFSLLFRSRRSSADHVSR